MVTGVPPATGPVAGLVAETEAAGSWELNRSAAEGALVPPGVVTVTSTVPGGAEGEVATSWVAESLTMVPAVVAKLTALAPARLVPAIVTVVPPAIGPEPGLTEATTGAAWVEL